MGKRLLSKKVIQSKWFVATVISIVGMLLASIALFFPNTRLWTILIVGIVVFIIVIYLLSYNRYLRLAYVILGGPFAFSWATKGVFAYLEINQIAFFELNIEEITSWQNCANLTICFVALLVSDIIVNHYIPYLERIGKREKLHTTTTSKTSNKFQNIGSIKAKVVQLTQNYIPHSDNSEVHMPAHLFEKIMNGQHSLGEKQKECEFLLQKQDAKSDTGKSSTDKDVKYIDVLLNKIEILKSQAQQAIDEIEYENYFEISQDLGKLIEAEENILPAMLLKDIYILLANMEITKANWLKNIKGRKKDLTRVKYYFEKAKNVRSE